MNNRKILIFGNSGSGKSTLARKLAREHDLVHVDLDSVAWLEGQGDMPVRRLLNDSEKLLRSELQACSGWVVEGCYTDLLELLGNEATEIIFMNLSIEDCIANAKNRSWEPHKYPSKQAQDENLVMLIDWIQQYQIRTDTFSYAAHADFYQRFTKDKKTITSNLNS